MPAKPHIGRVKAANGRFIWWAFDTPGARDVLREVMIRQFVHSLNRKGYAAQKEQVE